jgi:predicted lipase
VAESFSFHSQVGHSLGGALAALDAVFLALNLPSGSEVRGVTYGTPRVGNAAFAELLDSIVGIFIYSFFDAPHPTS